MGRFPTVQQIIGPGAAGGRMIFPDSCKQRGASDRSVIMSIKKQLAVASIAVAALAVGLPAQAAGVKIGVLTCHVSSGWGFIFGSSKDLRCNFSGGRGERYA